MIYVETKRLILRDWKREDLTSFEELNSDQMVMKYFPAILSNEESQQFYESIQKEFIDYGYGLYAVEVKEQNEFIGFIGFHHATFAVDFTPCIEIGWRIKKEYWNRGLASEGAKACLEYGFKKLNFKEIYSFTAAINKQSQRVMQKIGMHYIKDFNHPRVDRNSNLYKHVLYSIKNNY